MLPGLFIRPSPLATAAIVVIFTSDDRLVSSGPQSCEDAVALCFYCA